MQVLALTLANPDPDLILDSSKAGVSFDDLVEGAPAAGGGEALFVAILIPPPPS